MTKLNSTSWTQNVLKILIFICVKAKTFLMDAKFYAGRAGH